MAIPYTKQPLTFEDQANLLLRRGLIADKELLVSRLKEVNYYRLSAYWHTFRRPDDGFIPETTLDEIWDRYVFDRRLRLIVLDMIERIEVSLKTKFINVFSLEYGAFGHLDTNNFWLNNNRVNSHANLIKTLRENAVKSQEAFVEHAKCTYQEFPDFPLWKTCEIMTLNNLFTMYRLTFQSVQKKFASQYGLKHDDLYSWIKTFNYVRNICAHHSRLWNKEFVVKPSIPPKFKSPEFYIPVIIKEDKLFGTLTIGKYLMNRIAPQSKWKERLIALLAEHPKIPIKFMGFPPDWQECPIWANS